MKLLREPLRGMSENLPAVATEPARTRDVTWRDWQAIEQTNGLITLRHVPAAGGRTLSLQINGHDNFLVFPRQQGKTYAAGSLDSSVHFGGHYGCIGPERRWSVNDQPFNPHAGPYDARRAVDEPDRQSIEMVSLPGSWKGGTVSMKRTITMHRGNTHVIVDETVTNRGPEPLDFHLWDFTQIDGIDRDRPGHALRNLSFYLPLPRVESRQPYHSFLTKTPEMMAQFEYLSEDHILAIHFKGVEFKVASHALKWWIAAVDHATGWTYVKAFDAAPGSRYMDGNGPIEVYGSGYDREKGQAFVEMELLTGFQRCRPGKGIEQREHWYATTCSGPVLDLTPVGTICERLKLAGDQQYYDVSGRFGVFYRGLARLKLVDHRDEVLFAGEPIPVDPREEFRLSATLPAKEGAVAVVLVILDHAHQEAGELARVRVR